MPDARWALPNLITIARIALTLLMIPLILIDGFVPRLGAFVVFLSAAFSDLWDGHVARSRGLITDLGKLLDPIADKLLLAGTLIPLYALAHAHEPASGFPWFGNTLPLWVLLVIFGREAVITIFRSYAARRGTVIAAGRSGKLKAVFQNIFAGAAIFWYALQSAARDQGWNGPLWGGWQQFHRGFAIVALLIALVMTVYSMAEYLWLYRSVPAGAPPRLERPGAR